VSKALEVPEHRVVMPVSQQQHSRGPVVHQQQVQLHPAAAAAAQTATLQHMNPPSNIFSVC